MYLNRNKGLDVIALYTANYGIELYLRQISKLANLPLKTCQNVLAELEENKILKSKIDGKNKYFSLNLDNIQSKSYLLQAEVYKTDIFLKKYPQTKIFLKALNTNTTLIVFGSFAKFKADKESDFDLLVISLKGEKLPFHLLSYKVHQINISESSFVKALNEKETLIKEIEENHIILNNHSFYVNTLWRYYGK